MKRQLTEWEKKFANNSMDRGNIQNIKTVHTTQYPKKKKKTQSKNGQKI